MTKMHKNEIEIDEQLVRALLNEQCPQWAGLPLQRIQSSGTDNALFRLGSDYVVRLPRIDWEAGSNFRKIEKEYIWLPKLARFLSKPISEPLFKGNPDGAYPWPWTITRWYEGHNPEFETNNEYELIAKDLANFLNEFHSIQLPNGPTSRRGAPLNVVDEETRSAIANLKGEVNTQSVTSLWDTFLKIPGWQKEPVWVHGDFLPGNILVQNNRLCAVLDFSDVGIGDPACDLVIAWSLLNRQSRNIFKNSLANIDENTWQRGCGWAFSIALIMLPYYKNTNPVLATLARRIIHNVLHERD